MNALFSHIEPWVWLTILFSFLLAHSIVMIVIVNKKKKTMTARQLVTLYMALIGVRLLLFVVIIMTYLLVVKIEIRPFVLTATVIYFAYLLFDTLFLTFTEKQMKKK